MAKRSSAAGIGFDLTHSRTGEKELSSTLARLQGRLTEFEGVVKRRDYSDAAASLVLPSEKRFLAESGAEAKKLSDASLLIVVGIGGSNLGTAAVLQAVLGSQHNLSRPKRQVLFADTADGPTMRRIAELANAKVRGGEKIALNAVSKSGGTTETIANLRVLLRELDAFAGKHPECIVVTSDEGSKFEAEAKNLGFPTLGLPSQVGGRYSVFSNVGLFPLAWAGVDCRQMLQGASAMRTAALMPETSPAALLASAVFLHAKAGRRMHDHFVFSPDLEGAGKWYRQLMAESLGKEFDARGRKVRAGITPTVSVGSTDLHSMAQLYLGGPDDKFYRFVSVGPRAGSPRIDAKAPFASLVPNLDGRTLDEVMQAILSGTQAAFAKKKIPFASVRLPDLSEKSIGALLQMEMIEMMLLGELLGVDPFDQPAVEEYKKETKRILARKT